MALKEDAIYVELSTRIQELKGAVGPDVDDLKHDVAIIQGEIPSNASSENKLATAADVNYIALGLEALSGSVVGIQSVIPDTATSENKLATANDIPDVTTIEGDINAIEAVIPSSASSSNKLATAADIPSGYKSITLGTVTSNITDETTIRNTISPWDALIRPHLSMNSYILIDEAYQEARYILPLCMTSQNNYFYIFQCFSTSSGSTRSITVSSSSSSCGAYSNQLNTQYPTSSKELLKGTYTYYYKED